MSFNAVLKSKNIYLLYFLPFILAAIAFARLRFWPVDPIPCSGNGIISIPFFTLHQEALWLKEVGIFVLLCLSLCIFFIADRYKFLSHVSVLPAVIYSFLCIGVICRYGVNNYLVAACCVVWATARLQSAIIHTKSNVPVFGFGLFITLAILLCPKLSMLFAWALLVLPFSGRATFKDLVAFLIGCGTTLIFVLTYYLYMDRLMELPTLFVNELLDGQVFWEIMPEKLAVFIIFGVLLLASLYHVMMDYSTSIITQRRGMLSLFSMSLFIGSSLFFIPFYCHGVMLVAAVPLSYLFTQYFISHRIHWMGNVLFVLLLLACVVSTL